MKKWTHTENRKKSHNSFTICPPPLLLSGGASEVQPPVKALSERDLCQGIAVTKDGKFIILQAYFIARECLDRNSKKDKVESLMLRSII